MAVSKNTYGSYFTLEGTLQEVTEALQDEGVPAHKVISVFWDGSNYVAVYNK
jgi:hypothetical protein